MRNYLFIGILSSIFISSSAFSVELTCQAGGFTYPETTVTVSGTAKLTTSGVSRIGYVGSYATSASDQRGLFLPNYGLRPSTLVTPSGKNVQGQIRSVGGYFEMFFDEYIGTGTSTLTYSFTTQNPPSDAYSLGVKMIGYVNTTGSTNNGSAYTMGRKGTPIPLVSVKLPNSHDFGTMMPGDISNNPLQLPPVTGGALNGNMTYSGPAGTVASYEKLTGGGKKNISQNTPTVIPSSSEGTIIGMASSVGTPSGDINGSITVTLTCP